MPVIELTVVPPSLIDVVRDVRVAVDDARRDELAGDVDHLGAGRDRHVGADGGDLAVAQHDRPVLDGAAGHGENRPASQGDDAGPRLRLPAEPGGRQRQQRACETEKQRPWSDVTPIHDNLHLREGPRGNGEL